jgi:hypothetical protein
MVKAPTGVNGERKPPRKCLLLHKVAFGNRAAHKWAAEDDCLTT